MVASTIITHGGAEGVGAMPKVIARLGRVGTANTAPGVDTVVPVIIVIHGRAIPAPVVRLDRIVVPTEACVSSCYHDALASKA